MNCKQAAPHLPLMADGRLEEPVRSRVAEHVHACAACQAEVADLTRAVEFLHSAPRLEPSADFKNAIMAAASSELARRRSRATRRLRRPVPLWDRPAVRWAMAPATALFVLAGTWLYVMAPRTAPMIAGRAPATTEMAPAASGPGEEIGAFRRSIVESPTGIAVGDALRAVVEPRSRHLYMSSPAAVAMAMSPARPSVAPAPAATVSAKPFPATTGRVRPMPAVIGPVADDDEAAQDMIAAQPRSTHAKPYRPETGDEVASGLTGGLIANEVVVSDVMAKVAAESAVDALSPRGPSYKDIPRIAFATPKPKPSGPSYDDVPRLVFPGASAAGDGGKPGINDSSKAPGNDVSVA